MRRNEVYQPNQQNELKANGYHVAGGGKVYHHPPGFNRRSDWTEYFDQVFDGHYQAQWAKAEKPKSFTWPEGFPLSQLPRVKALTPPPLNPNEFDWGEFDKSDSEMGDAQMVEWAEMFLKQPPRQPFFLAAGIYRPHVPWYAPRKYFEMYPTNRVTPPPIKADDLDDLPPAGKEMAAFRADDLEMVRQADQYERILQAYLANVTFCDALVGRDNFDLAPEVADEYAAMVHQLVEQYYFGVSRYTTSGFLRAKLGKALSARGVAPHIYESAAEALKHIRDD